MLILHTYFYMWENKLHNAKDFSGDDIQVWMTFFLWKKEKIKKSEWLEVVKSDISILWGKLKFKEGDLVKIIKKTKKIYQWGHDEFVEVVFIIERDKKALTDEKWADIQYVFNATLLIHHLFASSDLVEVIWNFKEKIWNKVDDILK